MALNPYMDDTTKPIKIWPPQLSIVLSPSAPTRYCALEHHHLEEAYMTVL